MISEAYLHEGLLNFSSYKAFDEFLPGAVLEEHDEEKCADCGNQPACAAHNQRAIEECGIDHHKIYCNETNLHIPKEEEK